MLYSTSLGLNHQATRPTLSFAGEPRKKRLILPPPSNDNLEDSFYQPKKATVRVSDLRAILLGGDEEARKQVEREDQLREAMQDTIPEKSPTAPAADKRHQSSTKPSSRKSSDLMPLSHSLHVRNAKELMEVFEAAQKADAHERQEIEEEYDLVEKGGPSAYYVPGQTPHPGWVPIEAGRTPEQRSTTHKVREWLG